MTASRRGRLVALEGIDGSGKSTQARLLADRLGAVLTFEPGATALGKTLRTVLLDADHPPVSLRAEALLMAADRAQHVAEVVEAALAAGQWVVTDRFSGSTLAYQGHGRGLDVVELDRLVTWAAGGVEADLSILVDVPVEVGLRRRAGGAVDRLEGLGAAFQQRVADGFARLAADRPGRWVVVDGTGPEDEVADAVWSAVLGHFGDDLPAAPPRTGS